MEAVGGERVLAFVRLTFHGRASGLSIPAENGNVYEFEEGVFVTAAMDALATGGVRVGLVFNFGVSELFFARVV